MILLFDYDSLVYSAVSHIADSNDIRGWFREGRTKSWMKKEIVALVINRLEQMGNNIFSEIEETGIQIDGVEYFLTNDVKSIRREIYPEYKANRRRVVEYDFSNLDEKERIKVVNGWKARNFKRIVNRVRKKLLQMDFAGCHEVWEADDLIADRAMELKDPNFIIVSMDKDLKQLPGLFFDFYRETIVGDNGEPLLDEYGKPKKRYRGLSVMTPEESNRFYWLQVIMGDSGDNIKGIPKVGKVKANRMLDGAIDNDFETTARLAYSEYYDNQEEAIFQFDLNRFLISVGTKRNADHIKDRQMIKEYDF